jgi:cobyrinic acid a,c-diamide synthase
MTAGIFVSAAHKSSGKTTIALGLAAALAARGVRVQPFKKGPDYIDPMWLARAAGRPCFNLDPTLTGDAAVAQCFAAHASGADLALVEGNKGLYDGLALDGRDCNATLARALGLPVVLVIDARGMTRGIAPLLLGYQAFDRAVHIAGVILNQLGGARHEAKLRAVIEHYTDVPVLGAVAHDARLALPERHLGLQPDAETDDPAARVHAIGELLAAQVDLERLLSVAATARSLATPAPARPERRLGRSLRIGIARDKAFGFYYPDDLAALRAAGAELLPFDTLHDARLPAALDGAFIGGGFPELFATQLEANASLRGELRAAIDDGLPVYAECGGLMYLARSIEWNGRRAAMVGALPGDAVMQPRSVGRGYVHLEVTADHPWLAPGGTIRAQEFHHSRHVGLPTGVRHAYRVRRGHVIDGVHDGIAHRNVLASYAHLRGATGNDWPARFVAFVRRAAAGRRRAAEALAA